LTEAPWRLALHPLLLDDNARMGRRVAETSGDPAAGRRRVAEADALLAAIAEGPHLGASLDGALAGFRRRQGGRDRRLTAIHALDEAARTARVLLVAFGGADWPSRAAGRGGAGT
jgi:hypothetical protein